jgi:isopentenyl-diphosphate Delta-isomerase
LFSSKGIKLNSTEVMDYKWLTISDLKSDISKNPEIYTPWMKLIVDRDIFNK